MTKKNGVTVFLLSLVFVSIVYADETVEYDRTKSCYHSLHRTKVYDRRVWLDCVGEFQSFLSSYPKGNKAVSALFTQATVYAMLCRIYHDGGDCSSAIAKYRQVSTSFPQSPFSVQAEKKALALEKETDRGKSDHGHGETDPEVVLSPSRTAYTDGNKSEKVAIGKTRVEDVRCWDQADRLRVVFYSKTALQWEKQDFSGEKHYRLSDTHLNNETVEKLRSCVSRNRNFRAIWQGKQRQLEIVIADTTGTSEYNLLKPFRFVIDITRKDWLSIDEELAEVIRKDVSSPVEDGGIETVLKGLNRPEKIDRSRIRKVVIDPGHGGEDSGAVGPTGLKEKDVVLSLGKLVARMVERQLKIKAVLTRGRDVFINLEDRAIFANIEKADLFISLHANSSPNPEVSGTETFYLNATSDEGSLKLAARENIVKLSSARQNRIQADDLLDFIKLDLTKKADTHESNRLAISVQREMINSLGVIFDGVRDLGVRHALFNVLWGAKMPSILVEVSFISNVIEERRMHSDKYLTTIAEGITRGIWNYVLTYEKDVL